MAIAEHKDSANIYGNVAKLLSLHHCGAGLVLQSGKLHADSPLLLHKA
jgi:hypothetical protein